MKTSPALSPAAATTLLLGAVLAVAGCQPAAPARTGLPGYLEADTIAVAAPVAGRLRTLGAARGAPVDAGAVLFELEVAAEERARETAEARLHAAEARLADAQTGARAPELAAREAELAGARAALALAATEETRLRELFKADGSTKAELDRAESARAQAEAHVAAAAAALETARLAARAGQQAALAADAEAARAALADAAWRVGESVQRAPAAGLVRDTLYEPGEWVAAGHPVVLLRRPEDLRARFYVAATEVSRARLGGAVRVDVGAGQAPLRARIERVADRPEFTPPVIYSRDQQAQLTFLVEARLDPADAARLHPGTPVLVTLEEAAP